jgi:predicted O-methyltransferase YrrM
MDLHEVAGISVVAQRALGDLVRELKPNVVLEIGMANGVSSRVILSALNGGKLISIDPYQVTAYRSNGLNAIAEFSSNHRFIELPDFQALPQLLAEGTKVDLAYVDGNHTFDYTLLDFFYIDKMLSPGGVVGFNDCHMAAVNKVLNFVTKHRKYVEVPILPRTYLGRNWAISLARWVLNRQSQDRYFRKIKDWEPEWFFWKRF